MKKNLLFMLALLVSVSMVFVACDKDKDEENVNQSNADAVAGTYNGDLVINIPNLLNDAKYESAVVVEKTGDALVKISSTITLSEDLSIPALFENVKVTKNGDKYEFSETKFEMEGVTTTLTSGYVENKKISLDMIVVINNGALTGAVTFNGTLK